jgi:rare lipoprotein A (peptidoglycan hydrolase)
MYWLTVFLCILSIESVSESLGYQPATAIHDEYVQSTGMEMTDVSGRPLLELSAARIEKVGYLTPTQPPQPAPQNVSGEVTASWYGPAHHNKLTASGQRFNLHKNILAHRTLPPGDQGSTFQPL